MIDEPLPPPAPTPAPPRLWPSLIFTPIAVVGSLIVGGIVQAIALFAIGAFESGVKHMDVVSTLNQLIAQPWGPAALILPGQLCMGIAALAGALFSPQRLVPRLGYTRSGLPWSTFPLLLGGTYFASCIGVLISQSIFGDPGPNMRAMIQMMQSASGPGLVGLYALLCLLPPFTEESLFRGYLQRRLLQRWHPAAAIAVSSLLFTAAHFDPVHVLMVIPLGIWLGVVAWRCDSIWPSMFCHLGQNSLAFWLSRHSDPFRKDLTIAELVVFVVCALLTAGAIVAMRRHPPLKHFEAPPSSAALP